MIFTVLFGLAGAMVHAQKQLVLLKDETVLLRLYPGDDFVYRLNGSSTVRETYVNNLSDSAVVTHNDTIPFHTIDRIYFRQHKFYNTLGTLLVIGGAGLFLIDQANIVLVQGNEPNLDAGVARVSLASLAAGLPLMLIRKKSQRLNYRHRLLMVDRGSAFYRPDTRDRSFFRDQQE